MNQVFEIIIQLAILVFSIVIHEVSHGAVAYAMGDSTAKNEGRLTLNPLPHIDPFGSIILPAIMLFAGGPIFGWARPVPFNQFYLKNQKYGPAIVGAAGPFANILIAIVFGLIIRFSGIFSLPLQFIQIAGTIVVLNLILAVFNFVPIPPLDGSKVLFALLPRRTENLQIFFERYGMFVLLIFIFFFAGIIFPIVGFLFRIITGLQF